MPPDGDRPSHLYRSAPKPKSVFVSAKPVSVFGSAAFAPDHGTCAPTLGLGGTKTLTRLVGRLRGRPDDDLRDIERLIRVFDQALARRAR